MVDLIGDRYELRNVVGRGGMAEVRDGWDRRLERAVAVKALLPEMAARPDIRARFESEARSAGRLSHPNAVAVFDVVEQDGVPHIVMERLPGETLADRIAGGRLDDGWVLRMAGDVLGALGAAHQAGIIHRDVKPGNVLIGDDGCAKIADFGIAKSADASDPTVTGQLLGTPAYLAPERLLGRPATAASDLYSLGVVLYEALTGERPFTGDTDWAVVRAVEAGRHVPLGELRPDLDRRVTAAVERAMSLDPSDRFSTVAEMAAALAIEPAVTAAATVPLSAGTTTQVIDAPVLAASAAPVPVRSWRLWPPYAGAKTPSSAGWRWLAAVGAGVAALVLLLVFALSGGHASHDAPAATTAPSTTLAPTTTIADVTDDTAPRTTAPVVTPPPTIRVTVPQIKIEVPHHGGGGKKGRD